MRNPFPPGADERYIKGLRAEAHRALRGSRSEAAKKAWLSRGRAAARRTGLGLHVAPGLKAFMRHGNIGFPKSAEAPWSKKRLSASVKASIKSSFARMRKLGMFVK